MNTSNDARVPGWGEHVEALRRANEDPSTVMPRREGESMAAWTGRARVMVLARAAGALDGAGLVRSHGEVMGKAIEPQAADSKILAGIRHELARLHQVAGTHGNLGSAVDQFAEKVALWLGQKQGTYHPQDVMARHAASARELEARHWDEPVAGGDDEEAFEAELDAAMAMAEVWDPAPPCAGWKAVHGWLQLSALSFTSHADALKALRSLVATALRERRSS